MKFKYQAKTKEGELQVGFVEAPTKDSATAVLTSHDLFVLSIVGREREYWWDRVGSYFGRVKSKDLMVFTRQLSTLLGSRIPLSGVLKTLEEQTTHPGLKEAVSQINQDVSSGLSFSQALERQNHIFTPFFISMVRSAEITGNLEESTLFLADYLEKENVLAGKARSALVYPVVVIILFMIVSFIMITVVFPQISPIFEQAGVELPFLSQILVSFGIFMSQWWGVVLVAILFIFAFLLNYLQTAEGRALVDELEVRLPLLRKIFVPLILTRLSNVIAMLIRGGIPIAQATQIAGQTVNNVLYKDFMDTISNEVREGSTLSSAFAKYPDFFPPLASQMLVVGEATGQIDKMFERLATFYGRETDAVVSNLVELIQPILMTGIGVLVGLLFASILIPLYQLTSTIQ